MTCKSLGQPDETGGNRLVLDRASHAFEEAQTASFWEPRTDRKHSVALQCAFFQCLKYVACFLKTRLQVVDEYRARLPEYASADLGHLGCKGADGGHGHRPAFKHLDLYQRTRGRGAGEN